MSLLLVTVLAGYCNATSSPIIAASGIVSRKKRHLLWKLNPQRTNHHFWKKSVCKTFVFVFQKLVKRFSVRKSTKNKPTYSQINLIGFYPRRKLEKGQKNFVCGLQKWIKLWANVRLVPSRLEINKEETKPIWLFLGFAKVTKSSKKCKNTSKQFNKEQIYVFPNQSDCFLAS